MIIGRRFPNSLRLLICRIDVTALAAVLFVLVMALIVHPVELPNVLGVEPPGASHATVLADALRENSLLIAVKRDDRIFLGREILKPESLSNAIRDRLSYGAERNVYIRADKRARYGTVKKVLDGVRTAGIEEIAFLVDGPSSTLSRASNNR